MKRAKKILAVLLSMAMVLGMTATAFAGSSGSDKRYGTSDDTGTITVKGVSANANGSYEGITVNAYKIVSANYDATSGDFKNYTSLYPDALTVQNTGTNDFTEDQLSKILKTGMRASGTPYTMTGNNGTYTANVPVGSYLVVISGADSKVYNPMVVSVYYTNNNGGNDVSEGIVSINETNAWAKVTTDPKVQKTIVNKDSVNNDKGSSQDVGQTVSYNVVIDPIPYYGGSKPRLSVNDTLSAGLSLNAAPTVKVISKNSAESTLTAGTDYTYTAKTDNKGFTIDFVVNGTYTLNPYQEGQVVITYDAILTDAAVYNADPNTNEVTLDYTRDSSTDGGDGSTSSNTYSYTFDITGSMNGLVSGGIIQKTGESTGDTSSPLKDAEFTLYTNNACTDQYKYSNAVFNGTAKSDENGWLEIKGLKAGTYYLKETKAPDGYSLNSSVFTIEITPTYKATGELDTLQIKINGQETAHFTATNKALTVTPGEDHDTGTFKIPNTSLSSLPSTGGIGTTIFTVVGCIVMIGAAGLFFASRRKTSAK